MSNEIPFNPNAAIDKNSAETLKKAADRQQQRLMGLLGELATMIPPGVTIQAAVQRGKIITPGAQPQMEVLIVSKASAFMSVALKPV